METGEGIVKTAAEFEYVFTKSLNLWPSLTQVDFLYKFSDVLTRAEIIKLHEIMASHLVTPSSWFNSPKLHIQNPAISLKKSRSTMFINCKRMQRVVTLPKFEYLIDYLEKNKGQSFHLLVNVVFPFIINENRWDLIHAFRSYLLKSLVSKDRVFYTEN